jgi:hemerythrin-like domain-containing protein
MGAGSPNSWPDLAWLTESHRALRREAGALVARIAAARPATAAAADVDAFWDLLTSHERAEAELVWPALAAARPHLGRELDAFAAEHDTLERLVGRLDDALAGQGSLPVGANALAVNLAAQLNGHLAREEERIWPVLLATFSASEWSELTSRLEAAAGIEPA